MIHSVFRRISKDIHHKVKTKEPGLYLYLLFPISLAFVLTFIGSRIVSFVAPWFYLPIVPGLRVHHYTYGFFVLAASGYLALIFNGPRAKYLISLLHGFGLGLALDEFAMWLRLRDDDPARWSYDGLVVFVGLILIIISAKHGVRMLKGLWTFGNPGG